MEKNKSKVFVGVSGGVDSAVALALLKKANYDVTGVFLKVWSPDFLPCDWKEERRSAMRVCAKLGVPFMTLNCEKEYKQEVVDYMIREYENGRVPNPDVYCNKYVKFGVFLKKAIDMGADYIATGHYARVGVRDNRYELSEGVDKNKDQSYLLYTLNQKQLSHILFPIGHLTKPEVRKLAKKFELSNAEKKDSQGVCFLGKLDMKDFLTHYIREKKGDVLNLEHEKIGFHNGVVYLTIGQRHGFTITKKGIKDPKFYVVSKDLKNNTITVASMEKNKNALYSTKNIIISELHFIEEKKFKFPLKTLVRIRYRQKNQRCTIFKKNDEYCIQFEKLQNAVAIGQSAVFYEGSTCIGGGIIEKTY